MSLPDDQIGLLQTAANALHTWQNTAEGAGISLQQVVMEFPPDGTTNMIQFTWVPATPGRDAVVDGEGNEIEPAVPPTVGRFDIATLT